MSQISQGDPELIRMMVDPIQVLSSLYIHIDTHACVHIHIYIYILYVRMVYGSGLKASGFEFGVYRGCNNLNKI